MLTCALPAAAAGHNRYHSLPPSAPLSILQPWPQVLSESEDWSDSGSDAEEDKLPLSARAPLAPRSAAAAGAAGGGQQLQLAFRVLQGPVEIDLTLDGDLPCMVSCSWWAGCWA